MAYDKRWHDSAPEEVARPTKHIRPDTLEKRLFQRTKTTTLPDLPGEVLVEIFHHSREPSMIHTCKRLWILLPDFVAYTKNLVGLAYTPKNERNPLYQYQDKLWSLPGHEGATWTHAERDDLQQQVAGSSWLQISHLEKTHATLFRSLVKLQLLDNPDMRVSCFFDQSTVMWLCKIEEDEVDPEMHIDVRVEVTGSGATADSAWARIRDNLIMIDSGDDDSKIVAVLGVKFVPNCLITHEPADETSALRQLFLRSALLDSTVDLTELDIDEPELPLNTGKLPSNMICDGDLLAERIRRTVEHPAKDPSKKGGHINDSEHLWIWLMINQACRCPVTVTSKMLEACIANNLPDCLRLLLGNYFVSTCNINFPGGSIKNPDLRRPTTVTEEDLKKLRAIAESSAARHGDCDCYHIIHQELDDMELWKFEAAGRGFESVAAMEKFDWDQEGKYTAYRVAADSEDDDSIYTLDYEAWRDHIIGDENE